MNTISEMPNDTLSKSVDAFASAVEAYIGNEAGLDATRTHVAMLREAARRLSPPASGEVLAADMPAPDTFVRLPDGTRGLAIWYYLRGCLSLTDNQADQVIEANGLEKKVVKLGILGDLSSKVRHSRQSGDTLAIRQHLLPYQTDGDGWKLFAHTETEDTFDLIYVRRPQTEAEAA